MVPHSDLRSVGVIARVGRSESVAILGAFLKAGYVKGTLRKRKKWGFSGQVAAMHPRYDRIDAVPCSPSLSAIPFPVGLAVIGLRRDSIQAILYDCETVSVGAVEIVSSGLPEGGGDDATKQLRIVEWAVRTGILVVRPNRVGLMSAANGLIAMAMACQPATLKAGGVCLMLQSAMLSSGLLMRMAGWGIGVGCPLTTGNEACVDVADFINYFAGDEGTRAIAFYCEQINGPLEFIKACKREADNKPIVMIKVGRSEGTRQRALAHTGSDVAIDPVLKRLGLVRADAADDLNTTIAALSTAQRPPGGRVVFTSPSGAAVSLLFDVADTCGIEIPPEATARLDAILPEYGTVNNPLDLKGQSFYETRIVDNSLKELLTCGAHELFVWRSDFASSIDMGSPVGHALKSDAEPTPEVVFSVMRLVGSHSYAERDPQDSMVDPRADFDRMRLLQSVLSALSKLIGYAELQRARKPGYFRSAQRGRRSAYYAQALRIMHEGEVVTEREGKRLLALYGNPSAGDRCEASSAHCRGSGPSGSDEGRVGRDRTKDRCRRRAEDLLTPKSGRCVRGDRGFGPVVPSGREDHWRACAGDDEARHRDDARHTFEPEFRPVMPLVRAVSRWKRSTRSCRPSSRRLQVHCTRKKQRWI
ncbi:acyl-CoA synthetase (NDP forming) [Bradyrhizobium sp. USDA 3686]|nr:CoA-binding protein [Bradyrhizobium canariense]MBM7487951.1 acetyltransferase [Bradyrhizobium canariense]